MIIVTSFKSSAEIRNQESVNAVLRVSEKKQEKIYPLILLIHLRNIGSL